MKNANIARNPLPTLATFLALLMGTNALAENGFVSAMSTQVPGSIEVASDSIVQIVMLGETPRKIPKEHYNGYLSNPHSVSLIEKLSADRVAECAKKSLEFCEIFFVSTGTAFLAEDNRTLWTAAHVVQQRGQQLSVGTKLNFEVFDSNGKSLVDTRDSKDTATLAAIGNAKKFAEKLGAGANPDQWWIASSTDFAKIKLSTGLPLRPLLLSRQAPKLGQKLYSVGYPSVREFSMKQVTKKSSDINSRVAVGKIIKASSLSAFANKKTDKDMSSFDANVSTQLMIFDLDGLPGQSGSPVMSESGEVMGIYVAIFHSSDQGARSMSNFSAEAMGPHFEGIFKLGL